MAEKKSININFRLRPTEKNQLDAIAEKANITVTELIRNSVEKIIRKG